jgi:hypothetical protein
MTQFSLHSLSVDFWVDSMSWECLFLPGIIQVDVSGVKVELIFPF